MPQGPLHRVPLQRVATNMRTCMNTTCKLPVLNTRHNLPFPRYLPPPFLPLLIPPSCFLLWCFTLFFHFYNFFFFVCPCLYIWVVKLWHRASKACQQQVKQDYTAGVAQTCEIFFIFSTLFAIFPCILRLCFRNTLDECVFDMLSTSLPVNRRTDES